jgi:predicted short-subunit dehydrogenase-like oxidoreductase (DUF2520 family)
MKPAFALIGPGKVGCAVSQRLYRAGYPVSAVIGRSRERAQEACRFIGCADDLGSTDIGRALGAQLILIAVPDDHIAATAGTLLQGEPVLSGKTLIHFSGLHLASCMRPEGEKVATLSLHPLLPFANREMASRKLCGCPCALEGDRSSIELGLRLVEALGGKAFPIASAHKALYHAAACITSNYLVTLLATAEQLTRSCGLPAEGSLELLLPLAQATLDNVREFGSEQGLTGPIVRGDVATVARHLEALAQTSPENLAAYLALAERTVTFAEHSLRLDSRAAGQIRDLLGNTAKSKN